MANDGLEKIAEGLVDTSPGAPRSYPAELDSAIVRALEETVGSDPHVVRSTVGRLLQNFPLSRFLELLRQNGALMKEVEAIVTPFTEQWTGEYRNASVPYAGPHPLALMSPDNKFKFGLLGLKDPRTAEHSIDAQGMARSIGWALQQEDPRGFASYSAFRDEVELAAVDHDLGKGEIAALFLLAPFDRYKHLPAIFRANLVDPKRKRPISGLDAYLDVEQKARFAPLLVPREGAGPVNVALVEELMAHLMGLMAEQKFAFHNIPLRYLAKVMRDSKEDGSFPDYVDLPDGKINSDYLPFLQEHKNDLSHLELIFTIHGMDGYEMTFRDMMDTHEASSALLVRGDVKDCVARLVATHHKYPSTSRRLGPTWTNLQGLDKPASVVAMSDVGAALTQERAYNGSQGRGFATVVGIFRKEIAAKKLADLRHAEMVGRLLARGNAGPGRVMMQFHQNVVQAYGVPWTA